MVPVPYIAAGGAALVGVGYLAYKNSQKSQTLEEKQAAALAGNANTVTSGSADVVASVEMDGVTEEYNLAREKYRMIAGAYPPRSWSLDMINAWIEEQSKKEELLKQYVALVAANATYVKQEDTSSLTYQQIESLIGSTQNTIAAGKEKDAQVKIYNNLVAANSSYCTKQDTSKMNASQVAALIEKTKEEIASNKEKERVRALASTAKQLADAFRATLNAPNYKNLTLKGQNAWDTATLNAMINLSKEGKQYCEYYFEQGGPAHLPGYFNQASKAWKDYYTIPSCILTSNTNTGRNGSSTATACREAFDGISAVAPKLGADGSVARSKKTGILSVELMGGRKANAIGQRLIALNM